MRVRMLLFSIAIVSCGDDPTSKTKAEPPPPPPAPPARDLSTIDPSRDIAEEPAIDPVAPMSITPPPPPPRDGFIGSACARDADCNYDGGLCLLDGFTDGMCTVRCDRLCPDRDGFPITFCVDTTAIAGDTTRAGDGGACVSRCNFELYPGTGCRDGYGCIDAARYGEPDVQRLSCMPGATPDPQMGCHEALIALGVDFELTQRADDHPADHPELTCHIIDPVILHPPIHGVDFTRVDGSRTPNILAACEMARALVATVDDLRARDVVRVMHYGTYNCRVIAGTDSLSRHGHADAIDIAGVELANGAVYTVERDFEQDVPMPATTGGSFLFEAVHRWHDARLWSIILTPNYNAAHRDHFHCDLTPGSNVLHQLFESVLLSVEDPD